MTALLLGLGLGFVSGLGTFTPVAAVLLVRGGIWGIVLAVAAVGEYVVDVLPNTPSRTQAMGLSARVVSGAFVGWMALLDLLHPCIRQIAIPRLL